MAPLLYWGYGANAPGEHHVRQGGAYKLARINLPSRSLANRTPFPPLGAGVR